MSEDKTFPNVQVMPEELLITTTHGRNPDTGALRVLVRCMGQRARVEVGGVKDGDTDAFIRMLEKLIASQLMAGASLDLAVDGAYLIVANGIAEGYRNYDNDGGEVTK